MVWILICHSAVQNGKQLYFLLNDLLTYGAYYDVTNYNSLSSEFMQFHNGLADILYSQLSEIL